MNLYVRNESADWLWNICGDFGKLTENAIFESNIYSAQNGKISVVSRVEKSDEGIFIRSTTVKNISDGDVTLSVMSSKFQLDGGEYEVYSQYNGWKNESVGHWNELNTGVYASSMSVRNGHSAAPFMALWSNQAGRGVAFHVNAYSAWEMRISKIYLEGFAAGVEAEFGIAKEGLSITLKPGEELELPEIIYYTFFNRTDMDCWKLHSYLNKKYPRKAMPVMYNTWYYRFDRFNYDGIMAQIQKAKELGIEYFVADAGWFGKDENWWNSRGDWDENPNFGYRGRMKEVADKVRENGMKFGLWLEPECASIEADIVKAHPEYFIKGPTSYFLDFANEEALDFIFRKTCSLIEHYGIEFMKFDFNADLCYDKYNSSFVNYEKGHVAYIRKLKAAYPGLYVENCASGGLRMSVRDGADYDGFWFTDDQSPYFGLDIFKNTLLRMPPQWLENWVAIRCAESITPLYQSWDFADKIISSNDEAWNDVSGVHQDFIEGFLTGGPIGFTTDLTSFTDKVFSDLQKFVAEFKKNRDFWKNAVCHILADTESSLVFEFRNCDFSEIKLVVFTKKTMQNNICVYPVLDKDSLYSFGDKKALSGEEIFENGIDFPVEKSYGAMFMTIKKDA